MVKKEGDKRCAVAAHVIPTEIDGFLRIDGYASGDSSINKLKTLNKTLHMLPRKDDRIRVVTDDHKVAWDMATYETVRITCGDIWRYIFKVLKWTVIVIALAMVLAVVLVRALSENIALGMLFWIVLKGCLLPTVLLSCLVCLALTVPGITLIAKASGLTAEEFVHAQMRRLEAPQN